MPANAVAGLEAALFQMIRPILFLINYLIEEIIPTLVLSAHLMANKDITHDVISRLRIAS
jgi:hypothetical protein